MSIPAGSRIIRINWLQDIPVFCQLSIFEPINVTYLCCFVLAFKCTFEENKYHIPVFRNLEHMHMRLNSKEMLRKFLEAIPSILHFRAMLFIVFPHKTVTFLIPCIEYFVNKLHHNLFVCHDSSAPYQKLLPFQPQSNDAAYLMYI